MKRYYLRGIGIGIVLSALLMGIFTGAGKMTDNEVKERAKELGMVEQQELVLADLKDTQETTPEESKIEESTQAVEDIAAQSSEVIEESTQTEESVESTEAVDDTAATEESFEAVESTETVESTEAVESSETAESSEASEESKETESAESKTAEESKAAESTETVESTVASEESKTTESSEQASTPAPGEIVTIVVERCNSSLQLAKIVQKAGLVADAKAFDDFLCKNGYDRKINNGTYEIPMGSTEEEIAIIVTTKKK